VAGELIDPPEIVEKFWNSISAIIKTKVVLDPLILNWTQIPEGKKVIGQLLSRTLILPRGTKEKVKHYARKMLGETFCWWKSHLNTKHVQKGQTPFTYYGDITPAQWEGFV